jgi:hypothetical protein
MTQVATRPVPQPTTNRRHLLLAIPIVAVCEAVGASSASAVEAPTGSTAGNMYDSEHIRRFYELARF